MNKLTFCILLTCMFSLMKAGPVLDEELGIVPKLTDTKAKLEASKELNNIKSFLYCQCGKAACYVIPWAVFGMASYLTPKYYDR